MSGGLEAASFLTKPSRRLRFYRVRTAGKTSRPSSEIKLILTMNYRILVLLAAGTLIFAGCEDWEEDHYQAEPGDDEVARVVAPASFGGYLIAAEKYAAGGDGDIADLYLVYLSEGGQTEWEIVYDAYANCEPLAAQSTSGYGFLVLAERKYSNDPSTFFLLKLTEGGHVEWTQEIPAGYLNRVVEAEATYDGGFVLLGYSGQHDDITLLKVDGAGVVMYLRTFGHEHTAADVEEVAGGFIILNNVSRSSETSTVELIRLDMWGDVDWTSEIWSTGWWIGWNVVQDSDGGFFIIGEMDGETDHTVPLVVKVDLRGEWLWRQNYYEATGATVYAAVSSGNGPLIAGSLSHEGGGNDGFALRANSTGDFIWWYAYGDSGDDWFQDAAVANDGGYVLAGASSSYTYGGDADVYVMKIDNGGGIVWQSFSGD